MLDTASSSWDHHRAQLSPSVKQVYLKGTHLKTKLGLFTRICNDKTRGYGFKLKEGKFRLDISKKILYYEDDMALEEVAQGSSSEVFKTRLDWGSEQPGHVENVPAHGKGVVTK